MASWKRILLAALVVYAVGWLALLAGDFLLRAVGASTAAFEAVLSAALFCARVVLYFVLARSLSSFGIGQALMAVLVIEAFDVATVLALGAPLSFVLERWWSSILHVAAACAGIGWSRLSANNSSKPTPLRGAA